MSRSVRMVGAALVPAFTLPLGGTAFASPAAIPPPPTNSNLPKELDIASPYIPQSVCDPSPKAGVTAFARLMANHYDEFNYGISRACNYGLTEHSEGRALDWMLNAYDPHERAVADGVISWLLAPDAQGRPAAMARRFGIMYMIFDHKIWGTYQMDEGWRPYNGSNPHTDHIHFSFSWDGAMQRTSWWTGVAWTGVTRGPGGPAVPLPNPDTYPTLRQGASGPDVQLAQKVIGVTADGVFGPATAAALKTWQSRNRVSVTGVLDQATWNKMVSNGDIPARGAATPGGALDKYLQTTVRLGSTGEGVKALQRALNVTADGAFGPQTEAAVKAFQKSKQLKVDGVVSPNVWRALAGLSYTKTGAASSDGLDAYLKTTIKVGSTGNAVKALQRELKVTADGAFGPQTEAAVRTFQKSKGLKVDGIVSPNVWRALAGLSYTKTGTATTNSLDAYLKTTIKVGSTGNAVKALQRELKVTADGAFGPQTETAVKAFQKAKQLKVDGIVSPNVWRALAGMSYTKTGVSAAKSTSDAKPSAGSTLVTTTEFDKLRSTVLANGARGTEVKVLQRALGGVAVDGVYGSGTVKAVRAFQQAEGLRVTGIADEKLWINLERRAYPFLRYRTTVLKPGSTGAAVRAVQQALGLEVDGKFGAATREAVRELQAKHHLTRTGYVGGVTWQALEREVRSKG